MLEFINGYLKLGVDTSDPGSVWPLTVATVLVAVAILRRQSRD